MALVRVSMFPGRDDQQKRDLVEAVTVALVEICGARRGDVWVLLEEVAREDWALAGRLYSDD